MHNEKPHSKASEAHLTALSVREWRRRFTESPDQFEKDFQATRRRLKRDAADAEPSYSDVMAAYLGEIAENIRAPR